MVAAAAGPVLEGLPLDGGGIPQEEDRKPIREYIYKGAIMSYMVFPQPGSSIEYRD